MILNKTNISGLWVIESSILQDNRGRFSRLYCNEELKNIIGSRQIKQINHSTTNKIGALRGLHFQYTPHAEMKIVRCLKGRVFDVAVDLRADSATFLEWSGIELTPDNCLAYVIPEGCAHGFQVLDEFSELLYLHTESYSPDAEGAIRYDEPRVGINWPLMPTDISARDLNHPLLENNFKGIVV